MSSDSGSTETESGGRHILPRGPYGKYRFPFSDTHLPIMYSLRAIAPRMADGS
ncbi:hypothetical protein OG585_54205 (plasmid) [Streptomyces sp. NBC_01340]|uniref:hypothetical protein n=1 Tax=unclassified Streptomyces TaxID=2593676 RepID=UPI0022524A71|nr:MULTISPECIES: hypothetical protein [unclassified Streptomyces]MCX4461792.1 hypothetical protein [Streptomyces sp. NBC_01719]MCX4490701.1 hypothetical protein [Streptomyces sp. NBC_01728]WSI45682.1 hypothetical protein OG585_54205 [Streptomyces sp. NBC_01340]